MFGGQVVQWPMWSPLTVPFLRSEMERAPFDGQISGARQCTLWSISTHTHMIAFPPGRVKVSGTQHSWLCGGSSQRQQIKLHRICYCPGSIKNSVHEQQKLLQLVLPSYTKVVRLQRNFYTCLQRHCWSRDSFLLFLMFPFASGDIHERNTTGPLRSWKKGLGFALTVLAVGAASIHSQEEPQSGDRR